MTKIRSAIVGCGSIHDSHVCAVASMENAEIAAVCDIIIERAAGTAKKYNCIAFADFNSLMDFGEFDVLHICTPHYLHADMAVAAAQRGKHVLSEKPMSISYKDALRVEAAVKESGVKYGVCFQNRYNESSLFIKNVLESGRLGAVRGARAFVTWDRDERYYASGEWRGKIAAEGGGVLINQSIHTLDLMQWLVGQRVENVKCSISTKRLYDFVETEDTADVLLDFGNGVRGIFYATLCYSGNSPVFLEIICEGGKVVMSDNITVSQNGCEPEVYDINRPTGEKAYWGTGHSKLISDFYSCIKEDKPFMIDAEAAKISARLVEDAYFDARTGKC